MGLIQGIEHFAIAAKDTVKLCEFYRDVLGFAVVYDNAKTPPTFFVKPAGGSMIEIIPAPDKPVVRRDNTDPGLTHVALGVADLDAAMAELKRRGIVFEGDVKVSGEVRAVFFRDPEGNILHLVQRPTPL